MSFKFLAPLFKNGNTKREHHRDNCEKDSDLLASYYRTHRYLNQEKDSKIKCWETLEYAARIGEILCHECLNVSYLPLRGKRVIVLFRHLDENVSGTRCEPLKTSLRCSVCSSAGRLSSPGHICSKGASLAMPSCLQVGHGAKQAPKGARLAEDTAKTAKKSPDFFLPVQWECL